MRARNILIVIAVILILFNLLSHINGTPDIPKGDAVLKAAYLIGYNILVVAGLVLLLIAFFIHKRVIRKRRKKMIDSLPE